MKHRTETFVFWLLEGVFLLGALTGVMNYGFLDIIILGLASSFVGRAVAYLKIFEWLRRPFIDVHKHPVGVGEYTELKPGLTGWRYVLGSLIECPICSMTWAAMILPKLPVNLTHIFAAVAIGWIAIYITEALEWTKARNWHDAGHILWRRTNGNGHKDRGSDLDLQSTDDLTKAFGEKVQPIKQEIERRYHVLETNLQG